MMSAVFDGRKIMKSKGFFGGQKLLDTVKKEKFYYGAAVLSLASWSP